MPDVVRLRNVGDHDLEVAPLGMRLVGADHVVDVPGRLVEDAEDFYLIESGNPPDVRAWPKATLRVESAAKPKSSTSPKE